MSGCVYWVVNVSQCFSIDPGSARTVDCVDCYSVPEVSVKTSAARCE